MAEPTPTTSPTPAAETPPVSPATPPQPWWVLPGLAFNTQLIFLAGLALAFLSGDKSLMIVAITAAITLPQDGQKFFFGSSNGSRDKDAAVAKASESQSATIASLGASVAASVPVTALPTVTLPVQDPPTEPAKP